MPNMDGLTATKAIRSMAREDAKTIPIIAMTANAYDEDRKKSKEAGNNIHLTKPIVPAILYDHIKEMYEDITRFMLLKIISLLPGSGMTCRMYVSSCIFSSNLLAQTDNIMEAGYRQKGTGACYTVRCPLFMRVEEAMNQWQHTERY